MKKQLISVLLIGAMVAPVFFSCESSKLGDLEKRVAALEGAWHETEKEVQEAVTTGSTILSATQADGVWTLKLSDGKEIVITPGTGSGGGADVTVEEKADCFVITINGTAYAIPKASPVGSLVFVPEDGSDLVTIGNDGATVKFLATPAFTSLDGITFGIADAREVVTKAGEGLFSVGSPALEDGLLAINVKGIGAEAGKVYIVALKATVQGASISSNYFRVKIDDGFNFDPEVLEEPKFKSEVQVTALEGDLEGFHRALIPNSAVKFLEGFNLKDWYETLPSGNVKFQMAPREEQNENVQNRYDFIASCLSEDGTWKVEGRIGTDCWNSEGKNGILIYTVADDVIKNKIFWQIDNPVPGMGLDQFLTKDGFHGGEHIEYGSESSVNMKWMIPAGEGVYDLAQIFLTATFPEGELLPEPLYLRHGSANADLQIIQDASFMIGDEEIIGNDGSHFVLGDTMKALSKNSRGLVWRTTQPSWASSIRENWSDEDKAGSNGPNNGEILGGWDGGGDIPGLMGWDINEKGLVTTADYKGWAFRSGIGLFFEYDYGEQTIGPWHWFYMWFNRRVCPEGAIDPDAR